MTDITGRDFGRYIIIEKAGEGGMAIVYKAYDKKLENHVALKIIRTDRLTPEMAKKSLIRFEREAKSLAQLGHPNIIKVLDYGETQSNPYIVMEYLPGGTLKERLPGRAISWQDAIHFLLPVAQALDFAHQRGIIHRDVKPSNILFNQAKQPVLSDFGIAKLLGDEVTRDLTSTGVMIGTPEYMSPEQAMGAPFDHRVDIYALGIIFYEMVTGRKPFKADTPIAVLVKQASEPLPRPGQFNKQLPQAVENVLLKALLKDPRKRYQNMGELIFAFNGLLASGGKVASTLGGTPSNARSSSSKWLTGLLIGGAALVILCLAGIAVKGMSNIFPMAQTDSIFTPAITSAPETLTPFSNLPEIVTSTLPLSTDTQPPTSTTIPTSTTTQIPAVILNTSSCSLEACETSSEDICVFGISPQPSDLIISLKFKQELNALDLPQLIVGEQKFACDILAGYPGRLFCNGATMVGTTNLQLISSTNSAICSGDFNIREYIEPTPTKRTTNNDCKYPPCN